MNARGAFLISLPPSDSTPRDLAEASVLDANRAWQNGLARYQASIVEIAGFVHKAWKHCERGGISFRSLFKDDAPVRFVFDRGKAMIFLAIAKNQALADGQHANHLPDDYTTLGKLAQIPAPKLEKLIEGGEVTPTMSRVAVSKLVSVTTQTRAKSAARKPPAELPTPEPVTPRNRALENILPSQRQKAYSKLYESHLAALKSMQREVRRAELRNLVNDCGEAEILK